MVSPVGAESLDKGICGPGSWEDLPLLMPMGSVELHGGEPPGRGARFLLNFILGAFSLWGSRSRLSVVPPSLKVVLGRHESLLEKGK